jgi:hypothetical protein|uniref:Bacteriophage T5 Orf172 DNA-binding domain-containing protein n=1 Tax=viral metagenome TaxID=1070528 RepID=A0A6C0IL22_9ZZZZ
MIYAFSNPCMPGILKVGMTKRKIESRLKEANGSDTWRPPLPYQIELAKYVTNYKQKEKDIHALFNHLGKRINPKKEFFETTLNEVRLIFNLIDGDEFIPNIFSTNNTSTDNTSTNNTSTNNTSTDNTSTNNTSTDNTSTNINLIANISPIKEWKKTTNLSDYLCENAFNQFIQWLQLNIPGIDKSYSYYKYIKIISCYI